MCHAVNRPAMASTIPFATQGPFPRYDPTTGNLIDMEGYYGAEISVIGTVQHIDQNGNVDNPVSRAILMR